MADIFHHLSQQQVGVLLILGVLLFLGGLTLFAFISLVIGIRGALKLWQLKQRGQSAVGEVIEVKRKLWAMLPPNSRRSWDLKLPVVRFCTSDGQWLTFTSINLGYYVVGNRVQIRYLPERPMVAELSQTTIYSGYNPTYFLRLVYGTIIFPPAGYLLLMTLPKMMEVLFPH
jgi:hypothetical protein